MYKGSHLGCKARRSYLICTVSTKGSSKPIWPNRCLKEKFKMWIAINDGRTQNDDISSSDLWHGWAKDLLSWIRNSEKKMKDVLKFPAKSPKCCCFVGSQPIFKQIFLNNTFPYEEFCFTLNSLNYGHRKMSCLLDTV